MLADKKVPVKTAGKESMGTYVITSIREEEAPNGAFSLANTVLPVGQGRRGGNVTAILADGRRVSRQLLHASDSRVLAKRHGSLVLTTAGEMFFVAPGAPPELLTPAPVSPILPSAVPAVIPIILPAEAEPAKAEPAGGTAEVTPAEPAKAEAEPAKSAGKKKK